jgi:anti-anti-sigma factor
MKVIAPGSTQTRSDALTRGFVCSCACRGRDVATVRVRGDLDAGTAPELGRLLRKIQRHARVVLLDLRQLGSVDPCGTQVIIAAGTRARRPGGRLIVVRGPTLADHVMMLNTKSSTVEVVYLDPDLPAIQALLELARQNRAASTRSSLPRPIADGCLGNPSPSGPAHPSATR